jgi:hypothetical protein
MALAFWVLRKSGLGALRNWHCLSSPEGLRGRKFQPLKTIFSSKRHRLEFLLLLASLLLRGASRQKMI